MRRFVSVLVLATVLLPSLFAQTPQPSNNQPTQQQQNSKPKCSDSGTYAILAKAKNPQISAP
jgi:hypothetical protein